MCVIEICIGKEATEFSVWDAGRWIIQFGSTGDGHISLIELIEPEKSLCSCGKELQEVNHISIYSLIKKSLVNIGLDNGQNQTRAEESAPAAIAASHSPSTFFQSPTFRESRHLPRCFSTVCNLCSSRRSGCGVARVRCFWASSRCPNLQFNKILQMNNLHSWRIQGSLNLVPVMNLGSN